VVVIAEIFISKQEVAGDIIAPVMAIPTGGGVMRVSSAIKPGGCHYEGRIMNAYEIVHILVTQLEPKAPGDPEPPLASVWCNFIALFSVAQGSPFGRFGWWSAITRGLLNVGH